MPLESSSRPIEEEREGLKTPLSHEQQTLEFLRQNGVTPLTDWKPGQSVLYVLDNSTHHELKNHSATPSDKVPDIARVDNPVALDIVPSGKALIDISAFRALRNLDGRVDYYVIDKETGPRLVRTSSKTKNYSVRKDLLFMPKDDLFPPSGKKGE